MGEFWKMGRSPLLSALLGSLSAFAMAQGAIAKDENLPVCQSPDADEFLVLVFTPSQPLREEVRLQVFDRQNRHFFSLGFSTSRNWSPTRLIETIVIRSAIPGKKLIQ